MKIAVAIDGSEHAFRAAKYALTLLGNRQDAELEVISVTDYNKVEDEQLLLQNLKSLSLYQDRIVRPVVELAEKAGVRTTITLLRGNPDQEIINHLQTDDVEHLVLGSRGMNMMQELALGSVSRSVMEQANCPVTIVK
ncbi:MULTISPECIES: universal stress protein [unclassified Sporosarcina]|uniref:universal stress protein n=1 Tax=unclassified Sporosarcina TaxID=2647733 RepID=UPI000C162B82|nr:MULTISPECIES: universal stress protein [unclassified Sporosarcina]PID05535.1 universal stress protein [Sporosarcina sp. P30]PID08729.1 universal stress protein [Sporosarcina sp. P31]PID11901.1 universal stress protein [Sporosarcina sp. P32b]